MNNINNASNTTLFRESFDCPGFVNKFSMTLYNTLLPFKDKYDLVFVCVGSDRSTGDALGPIIGSHIEQMSSDVFSIYGTLEHPVHAINLTETLKNIHNNHSSPFILQLMPA